MEHDPWQAVSASEMVAIIFMHLRNTEISMHVKLVLKLHSSFKASLHSKA